MKLPEQFFYVKEGESETDFFTTLASFREWVLENKPNEIEMTEKQFWRFTYLQPVPYEEKYWSTFCGIPLKCPEMTQEQKINLRLV